MVSSSSDGRLKCIGSTSIRDDISKVRPSRLPRASIIVRHLPAIRQEARAAAMIPTLLARCRTAVIAALGPSPSHSPSELISTTTPQPCLPSQSVDALLEESSLLALAEAIARKISHDRATIGQDRLLDAVVSQEVCRFTIFETSELHGLK